jgi:hypothetical protein
MGDMRNAYKILVSKQGKRPLRRPRYKWEDNIGTDHREVRWEGASGYMWLRIGFGCGLL